MSCELLGLLAVSDDPAERAEWAAHAAACTACAALAAGDAELAALVDGWRDAAPVPPARLEQRVLASFQGQQREATRTAPRRGRRLLAAAGLAAGVLLAVAALTAPFTGTPAGRARTRGLLAGDALSEAAAAAEAHARAIARLSVEAAPRLARAGDPALPAREAALLLSYRDRLRYLDRTIADVQRYIDENDGNAAARSLLLAAYNEKVGVLNSVLALKLPPRGES